jgi:hypothetical protein
MKGSSVALKPWSEDELFGLDSALDWGGSIEDIADFLGREVVEVERKASERNRLGPAERLQAAA